MRFSAASGIAIAPILFVIALLAILATAIAAGSSTFSAGTDQEKMRLEAEKILNYGTQTRMAISRLKALGCTDSQLSFYAADAGWYSYNGAGPSDHHCDVFHSLGGGVSPIPDTDYYYSRFIRGGRVQGVGSSNKSSLIQLFVETGSSHRFTKVCAAFNDLVKIPNGESDSFIPDAGDGGFVFWPAAFDDVSPGVIGTNFTSLAGKLEGCGGDIFVVLLVR